MSETRRDFTVGDLSFRLDADTGMIRAIQFRGHEVLRGIYPAVRGASWETFQSSLAAPIVDSTPEQVTVRLAARVASSAISLTWEADIEADARGTLRYHWQGRAETDCETNRTGLCALHAAEAAGTPCTVEHSDGTIRTGRFPDAISPHQPFRDIRSVTHRFAESGEVLVRFDGEVFEMEDQRNWTDASFKTYCRPLDWPKPYRLPAGTVVTNTITVTIRADSLAPRTAPAHARQLSSDPVRLRWPKIGFGLQRPVPAALRERARQLRPAHVRVETIHDELASAVAWAAPEADALDCELELAVLDASTNPPPRGSLPSHCSVFLFNAAGNRAAPDVVAAWRRAGFDLVATGTRNHFAELNRARPHTDAGHAMIAFGIDAQVHAFDDLSLVETLSQHGTVARQAASFGNNRPVAVGPIVLGPGGSASDSRLHSDFGAFWTLGSLAQLALSGSVARTTYFQLYGPDGILRDGVPPSPLENLFPRLAGATLVEHLPCDDPCAADVTAFLVHTATRRELILAHGGEESLELVAPFDIGTVVLPPRAVHFISLAA